VTALRFPVNDEGCWLSTAPRSDARPRPGLFLDRDGVIVEEIGFLHRVADLRMMPGIGPLIALANRSGIPVCVVTNQSGIARGMYGWAEFATIMEDIERRLAAEGARIDGVAACPFHPEFTKGYGAREERWRKPGTAMIETLAERLGIDRARSWFIGDKIADIDAARAAGLAGVVVVRGAQSPAHAEGDKNFAVYFVGDIEGAGAVLAPFFKYQA
jgi:D-glycero-D-manno-heptose 1,7-bisphosphate phosphatase